MSGIRPIKKVLVANRGEIAVRIMRTCRDMGIRSVGVYSEADEKALHVRLADEAWPIGPAPSSQSYLAADTILAVAASCGADAIHPGYGFLSESPEFAEACRQQGIQFIGPPASAIRDMGDKTAARALMQEAAVPMAPGTTGAINGQEDALRVAEEIGFPVLIKAAAGGGGKGMRIVRSAEALSDALSTASREASSAFGDGRVFIEKYIDEPRHIEIQIMADAHGNIVHLYERECSIQRRHQKVIEEAPSSILTPEVRSLMGEAAIRAARSCGYVGAGTVEFLLDSDMQFYFMEMNTRLQVEHPVTEWITGLDLVELQIRIAEGHTLPFTQDQVSATGHAIECRIYAEDPTSGFLPGPGTLLVHDPPSGPGIRLDSGVEEGAEIPVHYDPMISKLIAWGTTREQAIARMVGALGEYDIAGVPTTIGFCRYVMQHDAFVSGGFSTHFVDDHFTPDVLTVSNPSLGEDMAIAAALYVDGHHRTAPQQGPGPSTPSAGYSPWHLRRRQREA